VAELKENRSAFFIISTDTAYSALLKNNVVADVVVSVDGQMISHAHFMKLEKSTKFVFDLCSNSAAVKKTIKCGCEFIFTESGHPLSFYASNYGGKQSFIHLETGSGTVTIAAADFAVKAGFSKIKFFGADFSYINGKPYTKGTYLDSIYRKTETRVEKAENKFVHLLYRTEIIQLSQNKITTNVLNSYSQSLKKYAEENGLVHTSENTYESKTPKTNCVQKTLQNFDFADFRKKYTTELKKCFSDSQKPDKSNPVFQTLLPLCASIEEGAPFIAYTKTLVYTESL
ncbi:MAG: DUF115 domain-containing protein, partial [Treponema sp.]|nr:DUF115 domain-containing protein [Candidatus Treponema equifaecale]